MGKVCPEEVMRKAVESCRLHGQTTYAEVGRDLGGISGEMIRNWVRQADRDEVRLADGGPNSSEQAELTQLRRDGAHLEKQNRTPRAVTAYFAKNRL